MTATIDALIHDYTRRYVARDVDGVTELCLAPFLAIRQGVAIHLPDRDAVREHFATVIESYRTAGYAGFAPVAVDTRELGEKAAFTTVRWHATDARGAGRARHLHDVSHARDARRMAVPLVHEPLLSLWRAPSSRSGARAGAAQVSVTTTSSTASHGFP